MEQRLYHFYEKNEDGTPKEGTERLINGMSNTAVLNFAAGDRFHCAPAKLSDARRLDRAGVKEETVPVTPRPPKASEAAATGTSETQADAFDASAAATETAAAAEPKGGSKKKK